MSKVLLDKIQGCLLGVMLGDALGMPWEKMTRREIMEATDNRGVVGFQDFQDRRISDNQNLNLGDTTDDWQLTKIVADSILECSGFNREHMAYAHVEALRVGKDAWGKTTRSAIAGLAKGTIWLKDQKMSKQPSKKCSTGVMMKIAPLAIYSYLAYGQCCSKMFIRKVVEFGSITHSDARAIASAYVLGKIIIELLQAQNKLLKGSYMFANREPFLSNIVKEIGYSMEFCPCECASEESVWGVFTNCLQHAANLNFLASNPSTFFAPKALGVVIMEFMREPEDFKKSGVNIINIGGDTDTTASMVGALVGANMGTKAFPEDWIKICPQSQEALDLGEKLYKAFKL